MTRPIVWALMTLTSAAMSVPLAGDRIASQLGIGQRHDASASTAQEDREQKTVTLWADRRGHFSADVTVRGQGLRMLVDTGASFVALSEADVSRAGLSLSHSPRRYTVSTANGKVEARGVWISEIRIGDIVVRDVEAIVMPSDKLGASLLGMSFLKRLRGFEVSGQRLTLRG